ncbi:DIP1281 family NlpC/P60 protein [Corynebacterium cystitidis]|uniref:Cell wall-associated hydrolase, NlpC family n=1 Tax=Corynebacterium cystitidis DSM 20524 TaxID=1121357 RepID=A0A1H9PNB3_9CORY|nr:NlpC/P60 family protein [Corynebacterium cystitidis]WJY82451.1 Peptidoglycan endopeptidase RipA precursor [Corynebacterium cystitidis DSM 20524]SER49063.1 Cell wall-associated hydrolase, NlpC family [Corynebacterium cystitidis DSM 20524]SNV75527.1 cell wall-associated hydrolase [Corynebacterium cystitidis]
MLYQNRQRRNSRARMWLATVACTTSVALATSLTPAVAQEEASASALVSAISEAQAEIDRLNLEMGALREAVNKAIVDYGDAQSAAEQARQGAKDARKVLEDSQSAVEKAQDELNEVARSTYRNDGSTSSVAALDSDDALKDSLDRSVFLKKQRGEKKETLNRLEGERTAHANADSLVRLAVQLAEKREKEAIDAETSANELLTDNQEALEQKSEELTAAQEELRSAQNALEEIRPGSSGTPDHTPASQAREDETTVSESPAEPATPPQTATQETDSTQPTASPEQQAEPHTEVTSENTEVSSPQGGNQYYSDSRSVFGESVDATESGEDAAAHDDVAAELSSQAISAITRQATEKADQSILDREIPVPTLEQIQDAVRTVMSMRGTFDESNEGDLATAAAIVAATLVVLATQVSNADLAHGSSAIGGAATQEGANGDAQDATVNSGVSTLPAVTTELETDTPALNEVLPEIQTVEQITERATEIVADSSRAAKIETVIARAETQLGVPYAWGGGDANGPTKGIRDGGVADAHGDYNKIGFDCSGLTLYAFAGVGISLPHYSGYQYQRGTKISPSEAQRGDLLFWGPSGSQHVAIYLGDGMMIEAPQSGDVVKKSPVRWSGMSQYAVRLI